MLGLLRRTRDTVGFEPLSHVRILGPTCVECDAPATVRTQGGELRREGKRVWITRPRDLCERCAEDATA